VLEQWVLLFSMKRYEREDNYFYDKWFVLRGLQIGHIHSSSLLLSTIKEFRFV
jgi:hypothetical protein